MTTGLRPPVELPREYEKLHEQATALVADPLLLQALGKMMTDRDFVRRFTEDPAGTVGELGLEIPPGLSLEALGMGKPGPDWVPFEIVLGNCRTYWKKAEPADPYPGSGRSASASRSWPTRSREDPTGEVVATCSRERRAR